MGQNSSGYRSDDIKACIVNSQNSAVENGEANDIFN